MSEDLLTFLENIYENSGIPTAIASRSGRIIRQNKAAGSYFHIGSRLVNLLGELDIKTGLNHVIRDGSVYSYNIIKTAEDPDNNSFYIVELVHSETITNILNTPAIKSYMAFLSSKIRNMAGVVVNSADEIHDAVSCGIFDGGMITDRLNSIDRNIMSVTKEVIQSDQFYSLLDMKENEVTMSAKNELRRAINEAENVLGKKVKFSLKCDENDIFFRMDRSAFETVIGGFMAMCCGTDAVPKELIFSAAKLNDTRAEISVRSVRRNNISSAPKVPENVGKNNLFFSYTCDILCSKIGAVFTKSETSDGSSVKMEFDMIPRGDVHIAMTGIEYAVDKGHFETIPIMLADVLTEKRYSYYNIDTDDTEDMRNIESHSSDH